MFGIGSVIELEFEILKYHKSEMAAASIHSGVRGGLLRQ